MIVSFGSGDCVVVGVVVVTVAVLAAVAVATIKIWWYARCRIGIFSRFGNCK